MITVCSIKVDEYGCFFVEDGSGNKIFSSPSVEEIIEYVKDEVESF